jgi:DNA-binding transcriptional MerR regulator
MKIGELARLTGLSIDTLRWYEKIDLLPRTPRDAGGRRDYPDDILAWVDFLGRLKATGMRIADMRDYARLRVAGDTTAAARREFLERHRARVAAEIQALGENVAVLDGKIETYRAIEASLADAPRKKEAIR